MISGSGNDVVLPGNNSLPEPLLAQFYVPIWCDYTKS